jgi:hypothetical protein
MKNTGFGKSQPHQQPTLGDAPVEPEYVAKMNAIARVVDETFNGSVPLNERSVGFVLLVFPYGEKDGRCNYISNGAPREQIATLLEEQAKRFRGK